MAKKKEHRRLMPRGWQVQREGAQVSVTKLMVGALIFGGAASRIVTQDQQRQSPGDPATQLLGIGLAALVVGVIAWHRGFFHERDEEGKESPNQGEERQIHEA